MNLLRYVLVAGTLASLGLFLYIVATEKYETRILAMKITSYFCDLCGSAIPTEPADDVKGLNIRVDLDHGVYESFVFQHGLSRHSTSTVLTELRQLRHATRRQLKHEAHTPKPVAGCQGSGIGQASREANAVRWDADCLRREVLSFSSRLLLSSLPLLGSNS